MKPKLSSVSLLLPMGLLITTVIVAPRTFYDALSVPKLVTLNFFTFLGLGIYLISKNFKKSFIIDKFDLLVYLMLVFFALNLLVNREAFSERLFGIQGRLFGALSIFCYVLIAWISSRVTKVIDLFYPLIISNLLVSAYFIMQLQGMDFFQYEIVYSAPSSTLGNPNFVSGFLGYSFFSSFIFMKYRLKIISVFLIIAIFTLNLYVIFKSQSVQGLISLAVGCVVALIGVQLFLGFRKSAIFCSFLVLVFTIPIILGFLGQGLLKEYLQSSTTFSRLDYWRAAIRMTGDNLLFGVGFDAFGDSYRLYRDQSAVNRFGSNQVADSSHNIALDFFANGGILVGVTYIALNIYPVFKLLKLQMNGFRDFSGVILVAIWVSYQTQSLVSVHQIGVNSWGWLLLGVMVYQVRQLETRSKQTKLVKKTRNIWKSLAAFSCWIFAVAAVIPLAISDSRFLKYANRTDGIAITQLVTTWPQDSRKLNLVAQGWMNSGEFDRTYEILQKALSHNPKYLKHWTLLVELPNLSKVELKAALKVINRLDPLGQ